MSYRSLVNRRAVLIVAILTIVFAMIGGCASPATQDIVNERNIAIAGISDGVQNFEEAKQIEITEAWKDNPGKTVYVYLFNMALGGLVTAPIQCEGVPNSSTESIEPNIGGPDYWPNRTSVPTDTYPFRVPISDDESVLTFEMSGKDGTYGDPVPFRYCMTKDGQYYDFPANGVPYLISSELIIFPEPRVVEDLPTQIAKERAIYLIQQGKCVDINTLNAGNVDVIPCDDGGE